MHCSSLSQEDMSEQLVGERDVSRLALKCWRLEDEIVSCFETLHQWSRDILSNHSSSNVDLATQQKRRDDDDDHADDGIQNVLSSLKESITNSPQLSTKQDGSSVKLRNSIESSLDELKDVIMSSIAIRSATSQDDRMFPSCDANHGLNSNSEKPYNQISMKEAAVSIQLLKQHMETLKNCIQESDKVMDNLATTIETNQASVCRDVAALECIKENIPTMDHMVQEVYSSYEKSLLTSMTHQQLDSYYFVARTLHMEWIDLVE